MPWSPRHGSLASISKTSSTSFASATRPCNLAPWRSNPMIASATGASNSVIEIRGLTRRFGPKTALDGVSLTVPCGSVFGLVGANGAGKTTLIKHVLGLLKAQSGTVRVFGRDPVADPPGVLANIG